MRITALPWVYCDGGRADAGFGGQTDKDCVTRAIAIATGRPYREIHDMVDAAGSELGITDAAEAGVQLTLVAKLLLRDLGWQHIEVRNARLTREDLKKPLSDHRVFIAEVEFSDTCSTNEGQTLVTTSHLTAVVDGVVQDIEGMANPATGEARICDRVKQVYAPPTRAGAAPN